VSGAEFSDSFPFTRLDLQLRSTPGEFSSVSVSELFAGIPRDDHPQLRLLARGRLTLPTG